MRHEAIRKAYPEAATIEGDNRVLNASGEEIAIDESLVLAQVNDLTEAQIRTSKIKEIKAHALQLIGAKIPALSSIEMLDLIVELWPMLDVANAGPSMVSVKDIYLYAKTKITQAQTAAISAVEAYDPATDQNWP
jgi:hypothetical protein